MPYWHTFFHQFDWKALLDLVSQVFAALLCIIIHECAHGWAADRLGDHTARECGRLSWNPLRHIDPFGLLVMLTAGVGWAKPVPVDARNFRNPRKGMAITALAGPLANFLLAFFMMMIARVMYLHPMVQTTLIWHIFLYLLNLVLHIAVLSLGLGIFNLIPIPPLDGSKVLFSFLPDKAYFTILRYERYIMLGLFALVFFGFLDAPLDFCISHAVRFLCAITGFPAEIIGF